MRTVRIGDTSSLQKKRRVNTSAGCFLIRKSETVSGYELLLIRKQKPGEPDRYVLPKGHKEREECLEEAALRETTEESGYLNIDLLNYIGSATYELDWDEIQLKTDHYFTAKLKNEEKTDIKDEDYEPGVSAEAVWLDLVKAFDLLTFENIPEFLSFIKKTLKPEIL